MTVRGVSLTSCSSRYRGRRDLLATGYTGIVEEVKWSSGRQGEEGDAITGTVWRGPCSTQGSRAEEGEPPVCHIV